MQEASGVKPRGKTNPLSWCSLALGHLLLAVGPMAFRFPLLPVGVFLMSAWSVWRAKSVCRGRAIGIGVLFVSAFFLSSDISGLIPAPAPETLVGEPSLAWTIASSCVPLGFVGLGLLYINSLRRALESCPAQSRSLSSPRVWLLLVPLFNLVWHCVVVSRLASSYSNAIASGGLPKDSPKPGRGWGIAASVVALYATLGMLMYGHIWPLGRGLYVAA